LKRRHLFVSAEQQPWCLDFQDFRIFGLYIDSMLLVFQVMGGRRLLAMSTKGAMWTVTWRGVVRRGELKEVVYWKGASVRTVAVAVQGGLKQGLNLDLLDKRSQGESIPLHICPIRANERSVKKMTWGLAAEVK
jgi:hypothetical protein